MYVGTSKSSVLNLTAVLKGKDIYHVYAEYKSPYYKQYGKSEALQYMMIILQANQS